MYGIFTNIYPINDPNVGKYTIHGAYGRWLGPFFFLTEMRDGCDEIERMGLNGRVLPERGDCQEGSGPSGPDLWKRYGYYPAW